MQRIVVGVDGSEHSRRALQWALDEALLRGAAVDVVHAWEPPFLVAYGGMPVTGFVYDPTPYEEAGHQLLDDTVDAVDTKGAPAMEKILVRGSAAPMILDIAKGADMVVVGSRGRGGFAGLLLGSVSQQVAQHAPCPIVIVPPQQ